MKLCLLSNMLVNPQPYWQVFAPPVLSAIARERTCGSWSLRSSLFSPGFAGLPTTNSELVSHRGMKWPWGPGSMMNTTSVARTQAPVATAIAMWNPENS
jgi:hypothetical protein